MMQMRRQIIIIVMECTKYVNNTQILKIYAYNKITLNIENEIEIEID